MTYPPPPGEPLPPPVDPYDTSQDSVPVYEPPHPPPQPHPHQQHYRQPHQGQAHHGQPGWAPPYYGQPGYGPPGHGQAHHPPAVAPRQPDRSRAVAITLFSVAIALVVVIGGGTAVYLASDSFGQDDKTTGGKGTTTSAGPTEPPARDRIRITEPDTLNGEAKIEVEETASLTEELKEVLEGYPGAANAFGAVYGSIADKRMTAVLASEVDVDDAQGLLDRMFQSFSGENQLTNVTPASTGDLGGVAQCGSTVIGKENVALCGWTDEGSVGMILYFYKTAVDVKGDFPDMRAEIETKK
jgi:hypothetical protein